MKKLDLSTGRVFSTVEIDGTHSRTMLLPFAQIFSTVVLNPDAATTPVEVQAFRIGNWDHPMYGTVDISPQTFSNMEKNYKDRVYNQDLSITYEHGLDSSKGLQAAGWVKDVVLLNDSLKYSIQFTKEALQEIKDGKWRYFSPEYHDIYIDPESKQVYNDVLVGGSLTNAPFFKGMQPLNFSEIFTQREIITVPQLPDKEQKGGGNMTFREQLLELAKELNVTVAETETDDEVKAKCFSALKAQKDELEPLRKLREESNSRKTFAEQYPNEARRMAELELKDRTAEAKAFSDRYNRFWTEKTDGDTTSKEMSTNGLSAIAKEKIQALHLAFSDRTATPEMFSEVLDLIASGRGIVNYGVVGSSVVDGVEVVPTTTAQGQGARKAFSDHLGKVRARPENKDKDFTETLNIAATEAPELFEAYQASSVTAGRN